MFQRIKQKRGHSLLECMLAALIFSTTAVALMGVWQMQFHALSKSKEKIVAAYLAEKIAQECIAAGFVNVDSLYPGPPTEYRVRSRTRAGINDTAFRFNVNVSTHPVEASMKVVEVRIDYNDSTGPQSLSYITYLHRNG